MKTFFTLLMFIVGLNMNAQQQHPPLVSVVGEGIVEVVPDQVILQARVEHEGLNPSEVKRKNDEVLDAIFKFLKKEGIDSKDVQTTYLNLNKNYDYQTKTYSYSANQSISITIRDISKYEAIVTGLLQKGLNRIDGITFDSSEIEKHQQEARRLAILEAKKKAELYASTLNQEIGKAYSISETQDNNFRPYGPEIMKMSADSSSQQTIAPGEMKISIKVHVSFYLY
ncbi:MAG TPA: SIMPL domain-containing protein [Salinimicrobium sp.]|nr:SIMPL domain-containing protein [Salinimicrobium sp.]